MVAPNAIERVFVLVELKIPVDKVTPSGKDKVPAVSVYVPVAVNAYAWFNVTVPAVCVKVGTADNVAPGSYVNDPEVNTKLVEGVSVPCVNENAPVTVHVVQVIVPMLFNVPDVYVAVLEQVKLNVAKSIVPAVIVKVVHSAAAANVVVPTSLLIINGPVDFPLLVIVPVPRILAVKLVNVPPLLNVNPFKFSDVTAIVNTVLPKLNVLNQPPVVNVDIDVPTPVNVKFGALVIDPPAMLPN